METLKIKRINLENWEPITEEYKIVNNTLIRTINSVKDNNLEQFCCYIEKLRSEYNSEDLLLRDCAYTQIFVEYLRKHGHIVVNVPDPLHPKLKSRVINDMNTCQNEFDSGVIYLDRIFSTDVMFESGLPGVFYKIRYYQDE